MDTIKQTEMKELNKKRVSHMNKKTSGNQGLQQKSNQRKQYLLKYKKQLVKYAEVELRKMDKKTRKLMTIHKALHPREISCQRAEKAVKQEDNINYY